jgi:hypothetical protein
MVRGSLETDIFLREVGENPETYGYEPKKDL